MSIFANDIKLVASRVMDDFPEGGGAPTAVVIEDGASNAIFPDISELDRAGGDVSFRKVFIHVQTDNTDTYLGSNVIVAEPPTDPNVTVTLFSTGETFDERAAASGRVESYLVAGAEWAGFLFENHIAGQRTIQIFQRPDTAPPNVGETIILVYNEGLSGERLQYVRVVDTVVETRTYTGDNGRTFEADIASCDISDPLRYDFPGSPPSDTFRRVGVGSKVRESSIGDAAVYAGVSPITTAIEIGDISANVESIFTQLVPSAQTEIPLVDQNAAGQSLAITQSADGSVSYATSQAFNSTTNLSLGNAILPGTLVITIGSATLLDVGGQVFDGATAVGVVDYARGTVSFPTLASPYNGAKTVSFQPAAAPSRVAETSQILVTQESRAFNYVLSLVPTPAAGSVLVSYRAQGRWYDLRDNGGGVLRGSDSAYGAGSVNYATGAVSVTLGALPDDGSSVLFSWATKVNYINRVDRSVPPPSVRIQLPETDLTPGSITINWNDGSARSATDDGFGGIDGDASGTIEYSTGLLDIAPSVLPAGGQEYQVSFSTAQESSVKSHDEIAPVREVDSTIEFSLGATDIAPGTVRMEWPVSLVVLGVFEEAPPKMKARDNGSGGIVDELGRTAGSINYATGMISFQPDGPITTKVPTYAYSPTGWVVGGGFRVTSVAFLPRAAFMPPTGTVSVKFQAGGTPVVETPISFETDTVKFDLTNRYGEQIVPGSINFVLGGKRYFDRLGSLYNGLNVVTGEATLAGQINYSTGEVALSDWLPGAASSINVDSLLTTSGDHVVAGAAFRIPVSPVRPGSFQILATLAEGGTINVTANVDSTISGDSIRGFVDYETGVVTVEFGEMVLAAGNEDEPWYDEDLIDGDDIWKPAFVFAETIRFNAVAFSYLPLDADILGLDPVRLPQDGRVQIFRPGVFAVIGHTKTSAPMTVVNAQTVNLGRVRLSRVRVIGNDGDTITDGFTVNLEAGTITFDDVTGYSQPLKIEDRIEDMAQVSDVQINGAMTFTRAITHDYPLGSYISSALISNDLKARVSRLYDQASWDSITWSDVPVGPVATATYNNTLAPLIVTNRGAVSERWALRFTNNTTFQVIGEHVGVIDVGTINADCSPINPATSTPYFTIKEEGWGVGWSVGNIVRIDTVGAQFPVWIVRTVQQGAESVQDDAFTILVRGDVDRP